MNRIIKKIRSYEISSSKFILLSALYLSYVLNLAFFKTVFSNFEVSSFFQGLCLVLFIPVSMIPVYVLLNLVLFKYTIKTISSILIFLSAATNYFMFKMGTLIDLDMIQSIFETTLRESSDLITFPSICWTIIFGVIPILFLLAIKIKFLDFKKEFIKRGIIIGVGVVVLVGYIGVFGKTLFSFGRNNTKLRSQYNTLNYIVNTVRFTQEKLRPPREFKILDDNVTSNIEDNNVRVVVLVVGETAREKNFSLYGYERQTTPLLENNSEIITIRNVFSCGTVTSRSVPCMFSSKGRDKFDVEDAKYEENLLDIIKKAGWNVVWYENDDGCKKICNRIESYKSYKLGKNSRYCFDDYCFDDALLEFMDDRLKQIKQNTLIVLHTIGSHGPSYYKRYPREFAKFKPTCDTTDIQKCSSQELINTYDNTILYTDYIINSAIERLKKYKNFHTSLMYASDHGESLGEKGMYLHGIPYSVAPDEQKRVPFILWLSKNTMDDMNIDFTCLKNKIWDRTSHDNWFHTALGLTQTQTSLYDKSLDLVTECRK